VRSFLGLELEFIVSFCRTSEVRKISPNPWDFNSPPPRISKRQGHDEGEGGGLSKRRRAQDAIYPADFDDYEGPLLGPKHWTEDEKDQLFRWLLAPENDAHFNDMMADKKSCLRTVRLPSFRVKLA
jgi:hypothetical protein